MVDACRSHGDDLSDGKLFHCSRGSAEGSTRVTRKSCCGCSPKVRTVSRAATRDLAELVEMGALHRSGERKHTRYWLEGGS